MLTGLLDSFWTAFGLMTLGMAVHRYNQRGEALEIFPTKLLFYLLSGAMIYAWRQNPTEALMYASLASSVGTLGHFVLKNYSSAGQGFIESTIMTSCLGLVWFADFVLHLEINHWVKYSILAGIFFAAVGLPITIMKSLLIATTAARRHWLRQPDLDYIESSSKGFMPKVCFQVPCYSEPPEIVIETLDALAKIDYDNYEVLVIDNNTEDPALWKPLGNHCAELGDKFKFFHVAPLKGAKAGALNWAMQHTAEDAEIIAVIDSDYQAQPDFLSKLVGLFKNPDLGFVQTSHDYRDQGESEYKTSCYWEYLPFYKLMVPARNEWMAGFTVGTMCLVRKKALIEAGYWAEWCLTEDSELAVRIHAEGYDSYVVPDTFGRGLIPETFAEYKKQRFRWTVGPIQQLQRHWRMFLPRPIGVKTKLTFHQKLFELFHGLESSTSLLQLMVFPLYLAVMFYLAHAQVNIELPMIAYFSIVMSMFGNFVGNWAVYRRLGSSPKEYFLSRIATASLTHIRMVGNIMAILFGKNLAWRRTSKFREMPQWSKALVDTKWESIKGISLVALSSYLLFALGGTRNDVVELGSFFLVIAGLSYLMSPYMAISADYANAKASRLAGPRRQ